AAPAGELDVVAEVQLVGQGAHGGQRVAVADEDRVPVVAHGPQRGERAQRVVDAVLRAHDPQVGDEVGAPAPPGGVGRHRAKARQVGPVAHDEDVLGIHAAALDGDAGVGAVGGQRDVGHAV